MGLFDKKYCDICGEKIGLLGNRKLTDGNLCKQCAAKLSPWFSERRQSTVDEIKAQLDYREENRDAVASFNTTRTIGLGTRILLDEDNRKFMVTAAKNLADANPDVLDYSMITGCDLDVNESRTEMRTKGPDGKELPYNPPQYRYSYQFYMILHVNHPYFNEIKFRLNDRDVTIEPSIQTAMPMHGMGGGMPRMPMQQNRPQMQHNHGNGNSGHSKTISMLEQLGQSAQASQPPRPQMTSVRVQSSTMVNPMEDAEYVRYWQMGEEIKSALSAVREEYRSSVEAMPKGPMVCPYCGATTIPDAAGCCEYCGSPLNG